MADTGYSGNMAASTEGVDVEIDELIKAVVERGPRRKDALSKRFEGTGPQLLHGGNDLGAATSIVEAEARPQDEINSLMDDIRRDVAERSSLGGVETEQTLAADAGAERPEPALWLEDAVIAQQTMESHEQRVREPEFEMPERRQEKRGFGLNPFAKKSAAAAAAVGAVALGMSEDDKTDLEETTPTVADPDTEIPADALVLEAEEAVQAADAEIIEDGFVEDRVQEIEPDDETDLDIEGDRYAAALLADEDFAEEDDLEPALGAVPVAAMQAQSYGNDNGSAGLPVWLAMGIPVAAVSMAALVAGVHVVRESGAEDVPIEAASLAPVTVTYAEALDAPAISDPVQVFDPPSNAEDITLASSQAALPDARVDPAPLMDGGTELNAAEAVPALPQIVPPVETVIVSAPVPERTTGSEPSSSANTYARSSAPSAGVSQRRVTPVSAPVPARTWSAPERAGTNNVPSLKPQLASLPGKRSSTAPAVFRPQNGAVPVRIFDGRFERGSAALIVNSVATTMGGALNSTQQSWLARDMERALDDEIDGRDVSLKSDRGDRISVLMADSAQELRQMPIARESSVAALPDQMALEGGWYAARKDAPLRPTPSLSGTFRNRVVAKDALIERMATVTDRYGDRWYLMGQRGVAIGYMSPADLVLAGAMQRPLGLPFERRLGDVVQDVVPVFTRCRTVFVGPWGETRQKMDVCRNARGNWIGAGEGQINRQLADAARPEPIVLASAAGQSPELRPFETVSVRKSLTPKLVYGREGQVVKQTLADGRDVEMTLGAKFERTQTVPVRRLEALGRIERPIKLDARWMRVPGGARLRATPDYLTELAGGELAPGAAIETIGAVTDDRGEDWVLVGRNGVGFGYVQRQELMPLAGNTALRAVSNQRMSVVVDLVETVTDCRNVEYFGDGLDGSFTACQQSDGQWALSAEPALRQLVDLEPSSQIAP